jgi:mono/diheme cytochrome c family protein
MIPFQKRALVLALALPSLVACRGQTSTEPPIVVFRGMHEMPRYDVQEAAPYFDDGRAMRPPVTGTLPVEAEIDTAVSGGVDATGAYVATIPQAAIDHWATGGHNGMEAMLTRGQQRFGIYCAPCHGISGDGHGMVSQRATTLGVAFAAANLHDQAFLHMPDGRMFLTISNGVRTMPSYRGQIPTHDRWAIVAYVRALQLHQADPRAAATDGDGDHIPNFADTCPDQAEDADGFQDDDGCPDLDNDADTVPDATDACPSAAGPVETQGCPPDQVPTAAAVGAAVPDRTGVTG